MGTSATDISQRILEAVLAQKLPPATRLGEQQLALLFDCSRTIVREALTRLAARGIVTVSARRGWYLIAPSQEEAREAFEARRVIELGLIRGQPRESGLAPTALARLRRHLQQERAALSSDDVGTRSFLLGDFHVCLADCLGNRLLADTLRDFTARTTLIAMLYQSSHDAAQSCEEHVAIVDALERGDLASAETLMADHLRHVQAGLQAPAASDPLHLLRQALAPMAETTSDAAVHRSTDRSTDASSDPSSDPPAAYLGALL
ncbi:GntR family transcriptional regulator [Roseateles terrae]|uniref:DNA-binding GntR family transcriptional regulator n=1 Tax=Roseateles terrae TaxID=431060 RepID=A0ABR6GS11_9BURK|nr:GntR family transcriptional regulator [Roseateles terrae]MBB3194898.1 DNA-binding GntR family transcriptional regulator [Roseateles terrae]OWQ85845.1 GntR family transcriptional regulator [Roseateles terrae]